MKWIFRLGINLIIAHLLLTSLQAQRSDLPKGYEQILPRGRIAAITDPGFVSADEAKIAEGPYVLGVVIAGQAKAYSLNFLNSHEISNAGKTPKRFTGFDTFWYNWSLSNPDTQLLQ